MARHRRTDPTLPVPGMLDLRPARVVAAPAPLATRSRRSQQTVALVQPGRHRLPGPSEPLAPTQIKTVMPPHALRSRSTKAPSALTFATPPARRHAASPDYQDFAPRPRPQHPIIANYGSTALTPLAPWERSLCDEAARGCELATASFLERLDNKDLPGTSARSTTAAGISGSLVAAVVLLAAGGTAATALADRPDLAITPVAQTISEPVTGQPVTSPQPFAAANTQEGSPTSPPIPPLDELTTAMRDLVEPKQGLPPEPPAPPRPRSAAPTYGTLTSSYGSRWNTTHYGLDIANTIGTPVVSTSDGEIIDSGPADGFGLWIRVLQDDGTIGVYGHINETLGSVGQRVLAGEQIATVGNRGNSTGPHLHFEVWQQDGLKLDPAQWLSNRGIVIE